MIRIKTREWGAIDSIDNSDFIWPCIHFTDASPQAVHILEHPNAAYSGKFGARIQLANLPPGLLLSVMLLLYLKEGVEKTGGKAAFVLILLPFLEVAHLLVVNIHF